MRVAEIIAETIWTPGLAWSNVESGVASSPIVSVLLPTYCRAADGYFGRAVRSVLNQTLRNIELIIVDDASVDGSRELIAQFMREDSRISCLRHPRNVGLPAISEFEAYAKSHGAFIAFAFDDDEFLPDSLSQLLAQTKQLNADIIHGHVDIHATNIMTDEPFVLQHFGMAQTSQMHLVSHNFFANNSVMLSRDLIENIGFYDPNIAVTRNCDWDLWLRAAAQYRIHRVDVAMGKVSGPARKESLGRTYGLESYLSHEWTQLDRNARLRSVNFAKLDVQEIPESLSASSKMALIELHQNFRNKFWYERPTVEIKGRPSITELNSKNRATDFADGYVLVVVASFDATVILHFEHLQTKFRQRLRIVHAPSFEKVAFEEICGASAIIFVRLLFPHSHWIACAKTLGVPHYYFLDDNFSELSKTAEYATYLAPYGTENLALTLKSFSGVLLSTAALVDYFAEHKIHNKLVFFPPISKRPSLASLAVLPLRTRVLQPFTVLFFGGSHRIAAFKKLVLPALVTLSRTLPLRLISVGVDVTHLTSIHPSIEVIFRPVDLAYDLVLGELMHYRVDVLAHPGDENINNAFKNKNVLINAHHLQAVPLLSKTGPYLDLSDGDVAYLAATESEWSEKLLAIAARMDVHDATGNRALLKRLDSFINAQYCGRVNEAVIAGILEQSVYAGLLIRDQRSRLAIFQERCKAEALESDLLAAKQALARPPAEPHALAENTPDMLLQVQPASKFSRPLGYLGESLDARGFKKLARLFYQRYSASEPYERLPARWGPLLQELNQLSALGAVSPTIFPSRNFGALPFCEFALPYSDGVLLAIEFPLEVAALRAGMVGIELVDACDVIALNQVQGVPILSTQDIVKFTFQGVALSQRGPWRLRIFTRGLQGAAVVPVYRVGGLMVPGWHLLAKYELYQK